MNIATGILVVCLFLTGCGPTIFNKPGATQYEFDRDSRACIYEAEKYGQVEMWGTGIGAGIEENVRKGKLHRMCMEQKGYTAQR